MKQPQTATQSKLDHTYETFLHQLQERFNDLVIGVGNRQPIFTTAATGLFDLYLSSIPDSHRQHYTCSACRKFLETYGGLVTIDDAGNCESLFWGVDQAPPELQETVAVLRKYVNSSPVNGVFYSSKPVWGTPETGEWHHMAVIVPPGMVFSKLTQTASEAAAEKKEDYRILTSALYEIPEGALASVITLLKADALYRSEKCIGMATWLAAVQDVRKTVKNKRLRENLTWKAVATAPAGFCHPKSSMIGTLIEDIIAGMPFSDIKARFDAKMHPLQYQRPQAGPTAGNIAQAEKIIGELNAKGSLRRRFACLEDVKALWAPAPIKEQPPTVGGVFGHLLPRLAFESHQLDIPPTTMTWDKFSRTILPDADGIEFFVNQVDNFVALLTAADPTAPPILQWDNPEQRNPVSWYVYNGGSLAEHWNLPRSSFVEVTAVTLQPSMWHSDVIHQGQSVIFILKGAKDSNWQRSGSGLFPEILKAELHSIRATIEAYSHSQTLEGYEEATACGIRLSRGATWNALFRVKSKGTTLLYKLDRWD